MMYEKLKDFSAAHYILIAIAVALFGVFLVLGGISDHSGRTGSLREQLDEARSNQSEITDGIVGAQKRTDRIADGIGEAGAIIEECKRILAGVRARGEKD